MAFGSFLEEYADEYIVGWKLDEVRTDSSSWVLTSAHFNAFNATLCFASHRKWLFLSAPKLLKIKRVQWGLRAQHSSRSLADLKTVPERWLQFWLNIYLRAYA